jgi:glycosyltransferase involved in cell wall biosynthesis
MANASPGLPMVTVVTPVLNQAGTIRQTIDSVLAQDYPNLEHVVVDGGSTDGTVAILEEIAAKEGHRFRFQSGPDRGQSHALNLGIEMARGEIIGWQNGDDYYLPGAIRTLVEALQADPEAAVAYTGVLRIDEDGRQLDPWAVEPFSYSRLLVHCLVANQAALIRRKVLLEFPLREDTLAMDYDLWLKAGLRYRLRHVPGTGGVFRLTPLTPSGAKPHLFARDAVRFLDEVMADPIFPAELQPLALRVLRFKLSVAAPMLLYQRQLRESANLLRRFASLRPSPREWGYLLLRCLVGRHTRRARYLISRTPVLKGILAKPRLGIAESWAVTQP